MPIFRYFRFSLWTMLVLVLVASVPLAWVGYEIAIMHERDTMRARIWPIDPYTCIPNFQATRSSWRRLLRDYEVESILIPPSMVNEQDEIRRLFPEATIILGTVPGGPIAP